MQVTLSLFFVVQQEKLRVDPLTLDPFQPPATHTFRRFRKPSQEEAYPRMRRELVHWLTMLQSRRKV